MCIGYISDKGEWKIKAKLHFDDGAESDLFDFLIDSGAAKTILSPEDAKMSGIDIRFLDRSDVGLRGVGSGSRPELTKQNGFDLAITGIEFIERFDSMEYHHVEELDCIIVGNVEWCVGNLIGRDILNRFELYPDINNKRIKLSRIKCMLPGYSVHHKEIRKPERPKS